MWAFRSNILLEMPILLYRVDDRLIHGQVVVGWGAQLEIDYIAVVDDELAASDWEQDMYCAGLPDTLEGRFLTVERAVEAIPTWQESKQRGIVLTRDIASVRQLAESGVLKGQEINIGGLHDAPGRRRILTYVFLSDDDRRELVLLGETGVRVSARNVPSARAVALDQLLKS